MKVEKKWLLEDAAPQIRAGVEALDVVTVHPPQATGRLMNSNKDSWSPQLAKGGAERKPGRGAGQPRKWAKGW